MFGFLGCVFSKLGAAPGAGTVEQPVVTISYIATYLSMGQY